jgi:hypothetical protein
MRRAITLVALAAACSSGAGPSDTASVQLLQADPAAPTTVAFLIDNTTVDASVSFGGSSREITTAAGAHRLAIESLSGTVAELTADLAAGRRYYAVSSTSRLFLVEAGTIDSAGRPILPDTGQRDPLRGHIRFVNVASEVAEPPHRVRALVSSPATVDSVFWFGLDTQIASYGPLIYLNPGPVTVRIQPDGLPTILAEATFDVARNEVKAVILERDETGSIRLRIVVEQ